LTKQFCLSLLIGPRTAHGPKVASSGGAPPPVPWHLMFDGPLQLLVRLPLRAAAPTD
jgi:hypothetical protein